MEIVYPAVAALAAAGILRTELTGGTLWLYKSAVSLTNNITADSFTNCDFDGYAPLIISSFGSTYLLVQGGAAFQSGSRQFDYTPPGSGTPVTNLVYGWVYTIPGGGSSSGSGGVTGTVIAAANYDVPIPMATLGDAAFADVIISVFNESLNV